MPDLVSQAFPPERLSAVSVLRAYRDGFFPMGCGDGRLRWFSPDPRGILPLDTFRVPRGLRRSLPRLPFEVTVNTAFARVVEGCSDRQETWIDPAIAEVYATLHARGAAHSIEVWAKGRLAGGLYGVQMGAAFFGESMFSRVSEASKVALLALVGLLHAGSFELLDIQWVTPHLANFGAVEVRREEYLGRLGRALHREALFPGKGRVLVERLGGTLAGCERTR